VLRHLSSKEKAIAGVVDEYRHKGKRVSTALARKQAQEQHAMRDAFREHVVLCEEKFDALIASETTVNGREKQRRQLKYAEWQQEVARTRKHLRKTRT